MLYTQENVRDNIRNRDGKRVFYLGKEDRLTSGARDYLTAERIEIRPASEARVEVYRLLGGGTISEKPEHMTHLKSDVLVCKTHPRIAFRGAVDSLEGELLLCQLFTDDRTASALEEILTFARKLIRCEVMDEPVPDGKLCGLTEHELRERSHRPQDFYGQPHFMPSAKDGEAILRLNRLRCICREAELKAVHAFVDPEGNVLRGDIIRGLNRMSSMIWILMIQLKKGMQK